LNFIYKPIPGYYKGDLGFIECDSKNKCTKLDNPTGVCVNGEVENGGLAKNIAEDGTEEYGICLKHNNKYVFVKFEDPVQSKDGGETEEKKYVISHESELFGFDAKTTYVTLKVSEMSITFDTSVNVSDQCVIASEGFITSRKEDFCSSDSTGKYYTCENGKCITKYQSTYEDEPTEYSENVCKFKIKQKEAGNTKKRDGDSIECEIDGDKNCTVEGYYLIEKDKEKILVNYDKNANRCTVVDTTTIGTGFYWNELQYNEVIKCAEGKCDNAVLKESCSSAGDVIDTGYNVAVCESKGFSDVIITLSDQKYAGIFGESEKLYWISKTEYSAILDTKKSEFKGYGDRYYNCKEGICTRSSIKIIKGNNNSISCTVENGRSGTIFVNEEGILISENDKKGYMIKITEKSCDVISNGNGYYFYSSSELVLCTSDGCVLKRNIAEFNKVKYLLNAESGKALIKCAGSICEEIDAVEKSYYLDASLNESDLSLIYCSSKTSCSRVPITSSRAYISGDSGIFGNSGNIEDIEDMTTEDVEETTIVDSGVSDDSVDSVFSVDSGNYIILCNKKCEQKPITTGEIYLNGGVNAETKPLLKLNDNGNKVEEVVGTADAVYMNSNANGNLNVIIYCSSTTSCTEISPSGTEAIIIDIVGKNVISYNIGNKVWESKPIDIKVGETKAYYIRKTNTEVLTSNAEVGRLFVCTGKAKTNKSKRDNENEIECKIPSSTSEYSSYYVNFIENTLIQYKSSTITLLPEAEDGYYINSISSNPPDVLKCESSKCEKISNFESECKDKIGAILSDGKLCTYSDDKGLSLKGSTEKYLIEFSSDVINGITGGRMINADNKKVVISQSIGNYLIDKDTRKYATKSTDIAKRQLYSCDKNGCTEKTVFSDNVDFYSNDDSNTNSKYAIIKCVSGTGCEFSTKGDSENYCVNDKSLMVCNGKCENYDKCYKETAKDGMYLGYYKNYLIKCQSNKSCSEYGKADGLKIGYYVNNDISKSNLIQCYASLDDIKCEEVKTIKDGFYINEETNLIKCTSSKCSLLAKVDVEEGWYISGESGKAIIYCNSEKCTAYASPNVDYYKNGDKTSSVNGNNLIKCTINSGTVTCSESKSNVGYYMNSGSSIDRAILIKCDTTKCDFENSVSNGYYVNGDNSQLIYCIENECSPFSISGKGFYMPAGNVKSIISCSSSKKCTLDEKPGTNGYYLNGDPYTSSVNPLIMYENEAFKLTGGKNLKNGWYRSAETDVLNNAPSEAIIKCTSGTNCSYVAVKNVQCTKSIAGEFSKVNGSIQWCKTDGSGFISFDKQTIITSYSANDKIPGINLPNGISTAYAYLKVDALSITPSEDLDGYYYDESLYYCPGEKKGICTVVTENDFNTGIYINYKNINDVYVCERIDEEKDISGKVTVQASQKCVTKSIEDVSNIQYKGNTFKLNDKNMEDIKVDYMYLLSSEYDGTEKSYKFPGLKNSKYFRAYVNKYSIKLIDEIKEPSISSKTDKNLYYFIDKKEDGSLSDIMECIKKNNGCEVDDDGEYHKYFTNYGFYVYEKNGSNNYDLKKVYVYVNKNNKELKYSCNINDVCVPMNLDLERPIGKLMWSVDSQSIQVNYVGSSGSEDIESEIQSGSYIVTIDNIGNKRELKCEVSGKCELGEEIKTISKEDVGSIGNNAEGKFGYMSEHGFIPASKKTTQHMFKPKSKVSKREDNNAVSEGEIMELTPVSLTATSETRNVFLSSNDENVDVEYRNIIISEENLEVAHGYTCNKGICYEIKSSGLTKYYINTIQIGKNIKAYAVCGRGKCVLEDILEDDNLIFENAAATGKEDALITCNYSNGCQTVAISGNTGLPLCTGSINGDQYCINKGSIVGEEIDEGIYIFDVTNRKIDYESIEENHVYASMYYCKSNNECVQTIGYVKGTNGYSKFNSNGSEYIEYNDSNDCAISGTGAIIKDSSTKLCISESQSVEIGANKIYSLNINTEGVYPEIGSGNKILIRMKDGVVFTVLEDGYILIDKNRELVEEEDNAKDNTLYQCNSKNFNCVEVKKPVNGLYLSKFSNNVISCENSICNMSKYAKLFTNCNNVSSCEPYSYIELNETKLLFKPKTYTYIESEFPGYKGSVIVESSDYVLTSLVTENYLLMNKELYLCSSSMGTCAKQEIKSGWYVSGDSNYKAIKCENGECKTVEDLGKSCSNIGDLIYNVKDGSYQFCNMKTTTNPIKIKSSVGSILNLRTINGKNYKDEYNKFPDGYNVVSVNGNSVIGLDKVSESGDDVSGTVYTPLMSCYSESVKKSNELCKDSNKATIENQYCIYNDKLYKSKDSKCEDVSSTKQVLLLDGAKPVISSSSVTGTTRMYYCDGVETNSKCYVTTGYKQLESSKWFKCNYIGCTEVNELPKINDDTVTAEEGSYYYFEGENEFPGAENLSSFLVESGNDYLVIFEGDGYYLINDSNKIVSTDTEPIAESKTKKRSISSRGLYLCGSDSICVKQKTPGNGYYLNGATVNSKKELLAIIACKDNTCSIASQSEVEGTPGDITYKTTNCNENLVGGLIRDQTKKVVKLCINKSQSVSFTSTATAVKYYFINITKGNAFGDISISNDDESANILVKVTNRSMTQVTDIGYILYNSSNNEIVENTGSSKILYKCKSDKYSDNKSNTIICTDVGTMKNGWYFNEYYKDRRYISCEEGNCKVMEAVESTACNSSGSLIYNDGKFKLCKTKLKQVDVKDSNFNAIVTVSDMKQFPSIKNNDAEVVLSVSSDSVVMTKWNGYKVINENDLTLIEEENKYGLLYKCDDKTGCSRILIPNDNWYLKKNETGFAKQLINCKGGYGSKCQVTLEPKEGFYVSANPSSPIIQCIQQGYEADGVFNIEGDIICYDRPYRDGWFINADAENTLIYCNKEDGCTEKKPNDGWYINSGKESVYGNEGLNNSTTVYPIIKCSSEECNYYNEEIGKTCTKGGDIIIVNNNYRLCKNEKEYAEISKATSMNSFIVNVGNYDDFPGSTANLILVDVNKYGAVWKTFDGSSNSDKFYYKDKVMYKCNSSEEKNVCTIYNGEDKDGVKVLEEVTKNIYTASCTTTSCSWNTYTKEEIIFLDDKYKLVKGIGEDYSEIKYVYKCKKVDSKLSCNELFYYNTDGDINYYNGYYYNPNHVDNNRNVNTLYMYDEENKWKMVKDEKEPNCTYLSYKKNTCYISYTDEMYYVEDSSYKISIDAGKMCETSNGKYYFAISEINTGIDKQNCLSIPSDNSVGYYKIGEDTYIVDKYGAYVIDGKFVNSADLSIINAVNDSGNGSWISSNSAINCENKKCKNEKVINCSYEIVTGKCKLSSGTLTAGNLCVSDEGKTYIALENVSTSGGKCISYKNEYILPDNDEYKNGILVRPDNYLTPNEIYNVNNSKYYLLNKKIYKFNQDEVKIYDQGIYTLDSDNNSIFIQGNVEMDISESSKYQFILCDEKGCERRTKCNNNDNIEYIFDSNKKKIVLCNPVNNTIKRIDNDGYYLNKPWNTLIKCMNGVCKEINGKEGNEGYYRDAGNSNKIIECRRNGNVYSCSEEDIISCTFNENEGLCSSKKDLLRNSYCFYSVVDKSVGKIDKLVYIENFIKSGKEGKCVSANEKEYFYYYKNSKFMGHEERNDLLKVTSDSITSIYEPEIGYYVIDTKYGMGIVSDTSKYKSRLYECNEKGCSENKEPSRNKLYVNKASSERLVKYNNNYEKWIVIKKSKCTVGIKNTELCEMGDKIDSNEIVYIIDDDKVDLYVAETANNSKKINRSVLKKLESEKYIINDESIYFISKDKQSFERQIESGYYFFDSKKVFNLNPYISTKNETINDIESFSAYYVYNENGYNMKINMNSKSVGYYLNKADTSYVLQNMVLSDKIKPDETVNGGIKNVMKSINNICSSTRKNFCVTANENQVIPRGSVCVVNEGEYKGMYLAISDIKKNAPSANCVRYEQDIYQYVKEKPANVCEMKYQNYCKNINNKDISKGSVCAVTEGKFKGIYIAEVDIESLNMGYCRKYDSDVYQYIKDKTEMVGKTYEKILVDVGENKIIPFDDSIDDNNNVGYYVYDENKLKLYNDVLKSGNGYQCKYYTKIDKDTGAEEKTGFGCELITNASQYYYDKYGRTLLGSGSKWKLERNTGYYFFNEQGLPATTKTVDDNLVADSVEFKESSIYRSFNLNGRYLNSAVTDKPILVKYEDDGSSEENLKSIIADDLKLCSVAKDGTCKSTGTEALSKEDACYDKTTKKLYIVDEKLIENEEGGDPITMCYTGDDIVTYRFIGSQLYQMDGLSIKKLKEGYYMLNEKMQKFTSKYPRKPYIIVYCADENACEEITEPLNLEQEVVLNSAVTYSSENNSGNKSWLKYYNAESGYGEEKFMDLEDKYNCYCLNSEGKLPDNEENTNNCVYDYNDNCRYYYYGYNGYVINYAGKDGNRVLNGLSYNEDTKCTYDDVKDLLIYDGSYNTDSSKVLYKFINKKLFKLEPKRIYEVSDGLYLTVDNGKPFDSVEWTSLSGSQVCYAKYGICDQNKLKDYIEHKYIINKANGSIVTYDVDGDLWRTVKEDGMYFFFEYNGDTYSINLEDRRPSKIIEIRNGRMITIESDNDEDDDNVESNGFYIFDNMVVEKLSNGLEDAKNILNNVSVNGKRKCTAIERNENIENNEYCYNEGYGLCIVKSLINDSTINESNCMFNDEKKKYYSVINNEIYLISENSYSKVVETGLYVIGKDNLAYNSKKEGVASAYKCSKGKCVVVKELENQYYYNRAGDMLSEYNILYYNKESKSWRKATENGTYLFNENGYPLSETDKETDKEFEKYVIKDNGVKVVKSYINNKTKCVSKSSPGKLVVAERNDDNVIIKNISECTVVSGNNIKSKVKLEIGDMCNDSGKLVIITATNNVKREEENDEFSYTGEMESSDKEKGKIVYLSNEKSFASWYGEEIYYLNYEGYIVIDKSTGSSLVSVSERVCDSYLCKDKKCELLSKDKLKEGNHYVNVMNSKYPLLKYINNDKWKVENEEGYYFLDENMVNVAKDGEPKYAYEVYKSGGSIIQENIIEENIVGFYFNKAGGNKYVISNNNNYYSEGSELPICNVTVTDEGVVCKTMAEGVTYNAGNYCAMKNGKQMYFLIEDAEYTEEDKVNCVYGTNKSPIFLYSKNIGGKLNGVELESSLIQLDSEAIRVAKDGFYLVNQNNTLVTSEEANNEEIDLTIYSCDDGNCIPITLGDNEKIMTSNGEIIELDSEGKYTNVKKDGIYFFNENGNICSEEGCVIDSITQVSANGTVMENLAMDELVEGAYINEGDDKAVAVYSNKSWSIESVGCTYEDGVCINDEVELAVGKYCVFEGKFYIITEVNKETEERKCLPGNSENPVFFKNSVGKMMIIKEKSVQTVEDDGYYALTENFVAFESEELSSSKLVKCEDDECNEIKPEIGSYLNRSPSKFNIVLYPNGTTEQSKTLNNTCDVKEEGEKYIISGENVNIGDVCINSESLYLVDEGRKGYKVEKSVVSYQFVNGKLYMLNDDSVIQKMDGYYFITKDKRAITNKKDYSRNGTVGYMCSKSGECYLLEPTKLSLFPDYTTKVNKKFNVVRFNPANKSLEKREENSEEGSSGYDTIDEEGVYKMDDGSYAQCEYNDDEEISCHEIDDKGTYKTDDGEIISCNENDEGEIECSQATEGGYYWIDDSLYECEPNEDEDGLECEEVKKEGYFISKPDGVLYECEETIEETEVPDEPTEPTEDADISRIYDDLDANGENSEDDVPPPVNEDSDPEPDTTSATTTEETTSTTTTTTTEESTTTTEETTSSTTTSAEPSQTPVNVTCKPVECELDKVIKFDTEDLYECKKIEEEEENKWVPNKDCDSGNYVKEGDVYECEDEKDDVNPTNVEQPNTEHTSKTTTTETTTTTSETTTESSTITTETSTTTSETTTTSSETSTTSTTTTTTTTTTTSTTTSTSATTTTTAGGSNSKTTTTGSTTTTTTKSTTTSTGDGSGAQSLIRKLPSISFYLILFVLSYYIFN